MRLMSFIALFAAIGFGVVTIDRSSQNKDNNTGIYITFSFLLAAFAPKALQKFAEEKLPPYLIPADAANSRVLVANPPTLPVQSTVQVPSIVQMPTTVQMPPPVQVQTAPATPQERLAALRARGL